MSEVPTPPAAAGEDGGHDRFAENIMHFGRVLRRAGLPVGTGRILDAIRAVEVAGIASRHDFYWTLHAVFVSRREHREIFDQAFHVFWRNPKILERMMGMLLPRTEGGADDPEQQKRDISRRLAEALYPDKGPQEQEGGDDEEEELEIDASFTWSARERLQTMDFESMSTEELALARGAIARLRLPIMEVATRRYRSDPRGARVDMRGTLRGSLRSGGGSIPLKRKRRLTRHPPLVVLCDISGSMSQYSRMFLHFLHALTNDRDRVHTFLFGTRLTNVTRYLRNKDVDAALGQIGSNVEDWSGGTRIGHTLEEFNRLWSRRVLSQGAVVLFISDGLDRDAAEGLEEQIDRLHRSCRRLIWLNPLLRWDGFEPRSAGIRSLLPHVDEFRPLHNLNSLGELADALSRPQPSPGAARGGWDPGRFPLANADGGRQ
ncbi:VWA domain-containing protein [Marinibaculum pumilum]|uniref:VWA domain-containing protein n=1 Tax=Marinibaculum pumilum TaxID=1766165 RepID=A0ABV7KUN1_9PROT